MRLYTLLICLIFPVSSLSQTIDTAVVRIKSHGASGVVIWSTKGKSYILSCAHMFASTNDKSEAQMMQMYLKIDGAVQRKAPVIKVRPRLIAVNKRYDLSLIEINNGPFYAIPVSPPGSRISNRAYSLGYDSMKWPITAKNADIISMDRESIYTRQKPWHGRSGGALVDAGNTHLIGIVQGYETGRNTRGVYVSHARIIDFLNRHAPTLIPGNRQRQPAQPQYAQPQQYTPRSNQQNSPQVGQIGRSDPFC